MAYIMAQGRDSHHPPPVAKGVRITQVGQGVSELVLHVERTCDDVEDSAGQFHDSKGMLEALVRRRGVEQVRQSELMDVAQPLKRPGIDDRTLIRVQADENMNGITYLMDMLAHATNPWFRAAISMA